VRGGLATQDVRHKRGVGVLESFSLLGGKRYKGAKMERFLGQKEQAAGTCSCARVKAKVGSSTKLQKSNNNKTPTKQKGSQRGQTPAKKTKTAKKRQPVSHHCK